MDTNQNTVQETVFALLRAALWGEERFPFSPAPETDWDAVYTELIHHTVASLPVDLLVRENPAMRQTYLLHTTKKVNFWYKLMNTQAEMYQLLCQAKVASAVLKGAAADFYYPQPAYRAMGDIDLIVLPKDFDRALQLLLDAGWQMLDGTNPRHFELKKNGILLELHRYFSIIADSKRAELLDQWIYEGISRAEIAALENMEFPILPKRERGLVLLQHVSQHVESGLGLRQIIDWMLFVDRELDDDTWQNEFSEAADQLGLTTLALITTRMCQMYLGLREDITWCREADETLCAEFMSFTMKHGNFGRKINWDNNRATQVLSAFNSLPSFFRVLQERGCHHWTALQRHGWLRPFAWIYQIFRYARLGLSAEHPLQNLRRAAKRKQEQDEFLDRIGVRRAKNERLHEQTRPTMPQEQTQKMR